MPLGLAGKEVIQISSPVPLLVALMPMTILLMKETIMSKQNLLPTTTLLFLVYWLG
jgi:hypothetical protein